MARLSATSIMKNVYVLPTGETIAGIKTKNIYITNDEEIKEDYVIAYGVVIKVMMFDKETLYFVNGTKAKREECKKIILTTDQDLIKDGVQAIDDEFLEWFVKNPSCEYVKVYNWVSFSKDMCYYDTIIPKQEDKTQIDYFGFPKSTQEKVGFIEPNIIDDWLEKNGDPKIAKQVEQEAKELCEKLTPMNDLLEDLKETKISVKESIDIIEDEFIRTQINIFVQKTLDSVIHRIENELLEMESKWQQERMYSEEDMREAFECGVASGIYQVEYGKKGSMDFDSFIETFKKK